MATKDAVVLTNFTSTDHDAQSNQQPVAGETSFSDSPSDIAPKPMSKQDEPRVKVNADSEMKHKFCGLRARIAGLLVVTVAVWSLLLIPIVIFYVSTKGHHTSDHLTTDETICQVYNGSVCKEELLSMTARYFKGAGNQLPAVATVSHWEDAETLLFFLTRANPECATHEDVKPFICLHFFGLCDVSTGVSYRPCVSQCKNIRDNICMDEWKFLADFPGVSLPDCDNSEMFATANVVCDEAEGMDSTETDGSSGSGDLLRPYLMFDDISRQDQHAELCSNITCQEGFYCDTDANLTTCKPRCGEWRQDSYSTNIIIDFFIFVSTFFGIIGGIGVLIVAGLRWKRVLVFPSVLVVYQTITTLVLGFFVVISYVDRTALYCNSPNLLQSISRPSTFCIISGVVFYYCLSQLAIFWLCHILTIFWQLKFPFASRSFKNLHRMKYIHVPCVVIGLFLPVIPVAATMIQFSLGKNSTDAVEEGLGFGMVRFPPILCAGREKNTTFHSLILPLCLILMVGISFLVYIFWIIHKQQGLFRTKKSAGIQHNGVSAAERKILIVFVYYVIFTVVALLTFSQSIRDSKLKTDAIREYFVCESGGLDPDNPCDTNTYRQFMVDAVLSTLGFMLTGFYPILSFVFVVNFQELKAMKCTSCLTKCKSF